MLHSKRQLQLLDVLLECSAFTIGELVNIPLSKTWLNVTATYNLQSSMCCHVIFTIIYTKLSVCLHVCLFVRLLLCHFETDFGAFQYKAAFCSWEGSKTTIFGKTKENAFYRSYVCTQIAWEKKLYRLSKPTPRVENFGSI